MRSARADRLLGGTFETGLVLFTLGSLLCSAAPTLGWLIAFRMLQGGSMLNPVAMSIIRNVFTDPRERALFALAAAALVGLITYESRRTEPLLELRFFRSVPFSGASTIAVCSFAAIAATALGAVGPGFVASSHAAWWVVTGCGVAVLTLGLLSTTGWANATARRIAGLDSPTPAREDAVPLTAT